MPPNVTTTNPIGNPQATLIGYTLDSTQVVQVDLTHGLPVQIVGGGGGGGGASTIADGADVAEGSKADAAVNNPASNASVIALLKGLLTQLLAATPAGTNIIGHVIADGNAAGVGSTPYSYIAAASANQDSQVIKASAGLLKSMMCMCTTATMRYLKIYDKVTAPTSTDTPKFRIPVPANATSGAGFAFPIPPEGIAFTAGIAFRMCANLIDNDATAITANDLVLNAVYI